MEGKMKNFFRKFLSFASGKSKRQQSDEKTGVFSKEAKVETVKAKTLDDLEFLKLLGQGKFGKVFLSKERGTTNYYAVKTFKLSGDEEKKQAFTELRIMESTRHPFFVPLRASFQTSEQLHLVMDFAYGGDLEFHLSKFGAFSVERTRFYVAEMVLGIAHLHDKGIIHRDIKLENVLLDRDGHIRIADFGTCLESRTSHKLCGTPQHMAPEMIDKIGYDKAVDWWSLGVVVYRMLCGKLPFPSTNRMVLFQQISKEEPDYPGDLDDRARKLIQGLLKKNPSKRLGVKDIKKHKFFSSIQSWKKLEEKKLEPPFLPELTSGEDTSYFYSFYTSKDLELVKKLDLRPRNFYKEK